MRRLRFGKAIALRHWLATSVVFATAMTLAGNAHAVRIEFIPAVDVSDVEEFEISPDGTQIAFVAELQEMPDDLGDQTYVASINGGVATRLNPTRAGFTAGQNDNDGGVAWLPDGSAVLTRYEEVAGSPQDNEIYLVPTDGSQVDTQVTFHPSGSAYDQQVSPDGSSLFYSYTKELYVTSFPSGGDPMPTPTLLNPTVDQDVGGVLIPHDIAEMDFGGYAQVGSDIVFAGFSSPVLGAVNTTPEDAFYRTAADGSTANSPTLISITNFPDPVNDFEADIDFMAVTPDGQSIIFRGDLTTDGQDELYSLPIAGGDASRLLPSGLRADFDLNFFAISPDGSAIAFVGDYEIEGQRELFVIPAEGGTPIKINDPFDPMNTDPDVDGGGPDTLAFSPDSKSVFYLSDGLTNGTFELYRVANPIPEPTAILLLLTAGIGFGGSRGRRTFK